MIEDMRMRKFVEKTQVQYIRAVVRLTRFPGASLIRLARRICAAFSCTWLTGVQCRKH